MIKTQIFSEKQQQNGKKVYETKMQLSFYCEFAPLTRDINILETQRDGESVGDKKLPVEHTK